MKICTLNLISEIYKQCLSDQSCLVQDLNSTLTNCEMPEPDVKIIELHYEIYLETNYDTYILGQFINEYQSRLVDDKKEVYHSILNSIENGLGVIFFIDAPGSTGKTFLINLLLAKVHQKKNITLAIASSGIAATLLDGGGIAHSMFCLPLDLTQQENSLCIIKKLTKGQAPTNL